MTFRPILILAALGLLFASWFGVSAWLRHVNLFSSQFDLGIMDNVLWQTIHGHWFQMTSPTEAAVLFRAAIHADWLLLIYTPFYVLWPDPRIVTSLQVLAVASAAIPAYLLARRQLSTHWSLGVILIFFLQPLIHWSLLFDVHAIVLVVPLFIWSAWAAAERRWFIFWLCLSLSLLAKEEIGLTVALIAIVLRLKRQLSLTTAWLLGGLSLGWTLLMVGVIIPHSAANGTHFAINYFSEYGHSPLTVITGLIRHPVILWRDLVNRSSLGYLLIIIFSVAGLALRRPLWLLPALPTLVINLLSNEPNLKSIYFHYTSAITPFVILASIDGLAALKKSIPNHWLLLWVGSIVAVMVWLWAPLPGTRHHHDAGKVFSTNQYATIVRDLARTIPATVPLAVSNDLGPQFSRRDRIWVFPFALDKADAVVVLLNREKDVLPQMAIQAALQQLQTSPEWQTIASWGNELYYLQRR